MELMTAIMPIIIGFVIDSFIGDPYNLPHPIRLIGRLISKLEKFIRRRFRNLHAGGVFLALTVIFISAVVPFFILYFYYRLNIIFGILIEGIFCYYLIAPKCLRNESMKVYSEIK
jgi:adenosylcobinamide-phosphate synthase